MFAFGFQPSGIRWAFTTPTRRPFITRSSSSTQTLWRTGAMPGTARAPKSMPQSATRNRSGSQLIGTSAPSGM